MQKATSVLLVSTSLVAAAWSARVNPYPDYVIIGGGPSGFVLAEELSRNSSVEVVLLEAGPENAGADIIDVPGYAAQLLHTQYTWNYTSQPDPNIGGVAPMLHQGRGFGGGSAVNYLGACRGAPSVYDEWAEISGDDGFKWDNFYNDFKATVHFTQADLDYDPHINLDAYGNGPVELTAPSTNLGFVLNLVTSWMNVLGLPRADLNDGTGLGISTGTQTIRSSNRTRHFAPQAYGWQLAGRRNAQQLYNSEVIKIGFRRKKAVSVTYINLATNATRTLYPKEIILAAGALNSPKLLMLSGVGPAKHLQSLGIPVVADIPQIGQNLQDHHFAYMSFEVNSTPQTLWQYTQNSTFAAIAKAEYEQDGSGPLGVPNGAAFALYRAPDSVFEAVNDTFHTSLPADRGHLLFQYSSSPLSGGMPNVSIISPFVAVAQPQDAGYMQLASANHLDGPLIYSNYFGSAGDKAAMLYGYKLLRNVTQDPSFGQFLVRELYPGGDLTTDEELWGAISKAASTFHHPIGTVSLGTVVEGKTWRIKGLKGIRVVDTSTMPTLPTCHIMAGVYAYAYHAAQLIKEQDSF